MILAIKSHLGAIFLINIISIIFIAYSINRIIFGRRYEDDIDKTVLSFFLTGMFLFALSITADLFSLLGMNSYLVNSGSATIFKGLMAACFAFGAIYLQRHR